MAFYMSPPKGNVSLQKLQSYCRKRMAFLKEVFARGRDLPKLSDLTSLVSVVEGSDCLILGSRKDQISHFTLRLACCSDTVMSRVLEEAETTLFWYRFSTMADKELLHLFQRIRKYEQKLRGQWLGNSRRDQRSEGKFRDLLKVLTSLCSKSHRWEDMVQAYLCYSRSGRKDVAKKSGNQQGQSTSRTDPSTDIVSCGLHCVDNKQDCPISGAEDIMGNVDFKTQRSSHTNSVEQIFLKVPFQYVLQQIADRSVCVHSGFAYVPCILLPDVVANIFEHCLRINMELAHKALPNVVYDSRMKEMFRMVRLQFYEDGCHGTKESGVMFETIGQQEIDRLVDFFPPCMSHLHRALRDRHRLKHFSRLQYTLFLKDLGLPVHEALQFWQQEYSRDHCGHSCTHHWGTDGRRYTYNIRHLYGLEGSRVNYRSHCCQGILERILQPGEEGGCPWKHFDQKHLQQLLNAEGVATGIQKGLVSLVINQKPQQACRTYFLHKWKTRLAKVTGEGQCRNRASSTSWCDLSSESREPRNDPWAAETLSNGDIGTLESAGIAFRSCDCFDTVKGTTTSESNRCKGVIDKKRSLTDGYEKPNKRIEIWGHQEQGDTRVDAGIEACPACGKVVSDRMTDVGSCRPEPCCIHTTGSDLPRTSPEPVCTICSVSIRKPLDFTRAFVKLLEGLKGQSNMTYDVVVK